MQFKDNYAETVFFSLNISGFRGFIKHPSHSQEMLLLLFSLSVWAYNSVPAKIRNWGRFARLWLGPLPRVRKATNTQTVLAHISSLHTSSGSSKLSTPEKLHPIYTIF